jgi:hypothetical protein
MPRELVAVNMDTGTIAYRKTLGVSDALPTGLQDTGRPSSGGVVLTANTGVILPATSRTRRRVGRTTNSESEPGPCL